MGRRSPYSGRAIAAAAARRRQRPGLFASLAPLSFQRFEPHTFFEDGNKVFTLIAIEATHVASGKQYKFSNEGHLWFFNGAGKVVKYQHVTDTALHQLA